MGSKWHSGATTARNIKANTRKAKIKGGTPGEGSPLDPLLRFIKHKRVPRLSGARAGAPPLHPAAFEKAGETFKRAYALRRLGGRSSAGRRTWSPSPGANVLTRFRVAGAKILPA